MDGKSISTPRTNSSFRQNLSIDSGPFQSCSLRGTRSHPVVGVAMFCTFQLRSSPGLVNRELRNLFPPFLRAAVCMTESRSQPECPRSRNGNITRRRSKRLRCSSAKSDGNRSPCVKK